MLFRLSERISNGKLSRLFLVFIGLVVQHIDSLPKSTLWRSIFRLRWRSIHINRGFLLELHKEKQQGETSVIVQEEESRASLCLKENSELQHMDKHCCRSAIVFTLFSLTRSPSGRNPSRLISFPRVETSRLCTGEQDQSNVGTEWFW